MQAGSTTSSHSPRYAPTPLVQQWLEANFLQHLKKMVWVSNRSIGAIRVSVTNTSGGSADLFPVLTQAEANETTRQNLWPRNGNEEITITGRVGQVPQVIPVGANDFVRVYIDAVIISQTVVLGR